ncbi:MAG TPA: DciA family protein [Candidatus Moranbacteria bacterium]|nr:DciA family protein [Candidatus Moranbacteria bacterium]
MKSLKNLLEKHKKAVVHSFSDKDVFYVFSRVIKEEYGNYGAEKLRADFFKNRTVFVKSESPTFASELWINRQKIIRKMNEELGEGAVKEIKLK